MCVAATYATSNLYIGYCSKCGEQVFGEYKYVDGYLLCKECKNR